jgi:hypothetical protein
MSPKSLNLGQHIRFFCKSFSRYRPGWAIGVPGGWGSRLSRQSAHEGGKVVSTMHWPSLPPRRIAGIHFCLRLSWPQGHNATGMIKSLKNSSDSLGNRTCDLPVCSIVPQPTAPPYTPRFFCRSAIMVHDQINVMCKKWINLYINV